jgi:hypothetical protein
MFPDLTAEFKRITQGRGTRRIIPLRDRITRELQFRYISRRSRLNAPAPGYAGVTWSTCIYATRRADPPARVQLAHFYMTGEAPGRFRSPALGPHLPAFVIAKKPCFEMRNQRP